MPPTPIKGKIIVDASAFRHLATLRDGNEGEATYLDILSKLKELGFEILIPETVLYELNIFPNFKLDDFFDKPQRLDYSRTSNAIKKWMEENDIKTIRAQVNKRSAHLYTNYCVLARALDRTIVTERKKIGSKDQKHFIGNIRNLIANFHQEIELFKNCGETHCLQIAIDEHRNNPQTPTFLLIDDVDALKQCGGIFQEVCGKKERALGTVQVDGVLSAFEHNKGISDTSLLKEWGFEPHSEIARRITNNNPDIIEVTSNRQNFLSNIEHDTLPTALIDCDAVTGEPGMFFHAVRDALEMQPQTIAPPTANGEPATRKTETLSPLGRWQRKYGGRQSGDPDFTPH